MKDSLSSYQRFQSVEQHGRKVNLELSNPAHEDRNVTKIFLRYSEIILPL